MQYNVVSEFGASSDMFGNWMVPIKKSAFPGQGSLIDLAQRLQRQLAPRGVLPKPKAQPESKSASILVGARHRKGVWPRDISANFLNLLGQPQEGTPTIHVTGTKGKGSVSAFLASVLKWQGYRTGLFTSPFLHTWREDIQIDGQPISNAEAASLMESLETPLKELLDRPEVDHLRPFELLTVMAFVHFKNKSTSFNVVEVGIGGQYDATNVFTPAVSVITAINLDHTQILGDTVEQIAANKSGIIKPGRPVVTAPQVDSVMAVIRAAAAENGSQLVEVGRDVQWSPGAIRWLDGGRAAIGQELTVHGRLGTYHLLIPLLGDYQLENAATAVAALEVLEKGGQEIPDQALHRGFADVQWPCRLEVLDAGVNGPLVVADVAHNPLSVKRLREALPHYFHYDKLVLILGLKWDKDIAGVVAEFAKMRPSVIVTESRSTHAAASKKLRLLFARQGLWTHYSRDPEKAYRKALAMAGPGGLVLVCGTFPVTATVKEAITGITPELDWPGGYLGLNTPSVPWDDKP